MNTSPGPWTPRAGTRGTTQILDARGFLVAIVRTSTSRWVKNRDVYEGDPEGIANGRLIRNSPEMASLLAMTLEVTADMPGAEALRARIQALLEEVRP